MTKRTDIHRPSSPDFDPQAYELFGIFTLMAGHKVGRTSKQIADGEWPNSPFKNAVTELESRGWNTDIVGARDSVYSRQCGHCGAHIKYGALLTFEKELALIVVGEDCLLNRFESDLTKAQFQALREEQRLNTERTTRATKIAAVLEANPGLESCFDSDNSFVQDVLGRLTKYGELSERQIAAVIKAVKRDADWEVKKAVEARAMESAADAPTGKVTITGEILSTKWQESMYGSTRKMIVKTEDGWKLWVTVPSSIEDVMDCKLSSSCWSDHAEGKTEYRDVHKLEGKTVTLTATVTPSDRDPKFAFGKRPTKARLVS